MESKILGLDLGTNSIGICVRNADKSDNVVEQMEYFSSVIFSSGVGKDKSGEFSYAAERTKYRSTRRLYMSRKYRIWRTLEVLIDNGCCPLSKEDLDRWRKYDKQKGLKREYPVDAREFEQWVRLDFDNDGLPEYSSPYQLRAELMNRQFDFTQPVERYKLGRALYHIAQRRGFKSSKGDTASSTVEDSDEDGLKKSEEERSKDLVAYMQEHNCATVGCAFYEMEQQGLRVRRDNLSMVVRSQYEDEIRKIFAYQKGLDTDSAFCRAILSRKAGEGSIFYKRPLRSQKGSVGKCTLEPTKARCPQSRPEFELFRAWTLINNIRYTSKEDGKEAKPTHELTLEQKKGLFAARFVLARKTFKFSDLKKWLEKDAKIAAVAWNYPDATTVAGCPVVYRLKDILGDEWQTALLNDHYTYEDLWHVGFSADEAEDIHDFVVAKLNGDSELEKKMLHLWKTIAQGYAELSLKAIRNILYFLQKGYIYSDAVVLAKVPDLFGANWADVEESLLREWSSIKDKCAYVRTINKVTNQLISAYRILEPEEQFALHNTDYTLQDDDLLDVKKAAVDVLSKERWKTLAEDEKEQVLTEVAASYQAFFASAERNYLPVYHLTDYLEHFIAEAYVDMLPEKSAKDLQNPDKKTLYHPSAIAMYAPAGYTRYEQDGHLISKRLLGSPATYVFRNPMAMRVLHTLRQKINELIKAGIIDERDTRVVVETAREFNDANVRAAIGRYQKKRESENEGYRKELLQYMPENRITDADIDKMRLWHEQDGRCVYTGKTIELSELLNGDKWEVEHTIPRSLSYDDSLANKTLCDYHYNRYTKKTLLPTELPQADYEGILERIKPWQKKCTALQGQIVTAKNKAKAAATKDDKDRAIRDKHILEMQLDYWRDKVRRFMMQRDALNLGFRHNQLNDTRIITKYAYHFLKTAFNNVTVQRGEMTADFRKAFGLQSIDEKKNRSKHAHHAIDAAVLTLIPSNTKRDEMLDAFYLIQEAERFPKSVTKEEETAAKRKYGYLKTTCKLQGVERLSDYIEENILVQHSKRDQALTPASRCKRVRGKVVLDKNGKPVMQRGDILRGQLHKEAWYGAIAPAILDKHGNMQRDENGRILVDDEKLSFVVRVALTEENFANWDALEKAIVNKQLVPMMKQQFAVDTTLKEALEKGIYMLDGKGKPVNRIRHIRCYASVTNPMPIKSQTYRSKSEYKNTYYAAVGNLMGMAQYVDPATGQSDYQAVALFDVARNRKLGMEDVLPVITDKKGRKFELKTVLKSGQMVLLYENSIDELTAGNANELSQRLYVINGFETDGQKVKLTNHNNAKPDGELGKGESIKSFDHLPERIRCGIRTLKFMAEGLDFQITPKGIVFL